jgi:hypothetical protein
MVKRKMRESEKVKVAVKDELLDFSEVCLAIGINV